MIAYDVLAGLSSRLFLIVHRTWTWHDHGLLDYVVVRTISICMRIGVGEFKRREGERGRENGTTRRRRWMKKKHDDGPGIEPVSNLH